MVAIVAQLTLALCCAAVLLRYGKLCLDLDIMAPEATATE